jgi:dienelactone hydrolase
MTIATRTVSYRHQETALTGLLAWDDALPLPRPGILLVHGGAGLDDHAKAQARRYASRGYAVLACDMLGEGIAGDRQRIVGRLTELRGEPDVMVGCAQAGLVALSAGPEVNGVLAAVGFCFGGLTVLTMARGGVELAGVVSIHGTLATVRPAEPGSIKAKVLACHGALDPHVPLSDVTAFAAEMDAAGADWQLIMYGGAVHGFTHEHAIPGAIPGVEFNAVADSRSFAAVGAFLDELAAAS